MCKEVDNKIFVNIQTGKEIDLETINKLPDNSMLKKRPDLWVEWHEDKNKNIEFPYDVLTITQGVNKKVWWVCHKCKQDFEMQPKHRANANTNCPSCRKKIVH